MKKALYLYLHANEPDTQKSTFFARVQKKSRLKALI